MSVGKHNGTLLRPSSAFSFYMAPNYFASNITTAGEMLQSTAYLMKYAIGLIAS